MIDFKTITGLLIQPKSPFPEIIRRRLDIHERQFQAFVGASLPLVHDVIIRVEDRLRNLVDSPCNIGVFEVQEEILVEAVYFFEDFRPEKHEAAGGVLDFKLLVVAGFPHFKVVAPLGERTRECQPDEQVPERGIPFA